MSNGYGRNSTVVVAACNASSASQAAADYVCTGANDNVVIQRAIRTLTPAGGGIGGRVILSEGTYQRTNPVYIDSNRISLEGQGDSTQLTASSSASGSAHIIVGSNGAYDGVVYTGGDTAPTALPLEVNVRGMIFSDFSSAGVALAGSASGLICRGSNVHISDVNVQTVQLDGLRWEGFRQMGSRGTLGAAVTATPAWGTSENWTVTMASPPTAPFTCIVTPSGGGDFDPEIVNVSNVSGTSWTVQRGWMQTAAKTHASGASIAVLNVTTTFNNMTRDCFLFSPLRSGLFTQQGLDDSEWVGCQIDGGQNDSAEYTANGIWAGGSNCRWIACHPYFCAQNGFYGNVQTNGNPVHVIIGGEYENCGGAGIAIQQSDHVTIEGGVSMYGNANADIIMSYVTDFRIHDIWMGSPTNRHIQLNNCIQGTVHDNVMLGLSSGYMIEVQGSGTNVNAEIVIHDNIFAVSGSSFATALNLCDVAGVRVHDNVLEAGILENGTSDYNVITSNTMVSPANGITVAGAHTRSYDNSGVSDYVFVGSSVTHTAESDQLYCLSGANNTVTLQPPGYAAGSTALASGSVGVALPATSITLAAAPWAWPASGTALIPVSGGYACVYYRSINGNVLAGCTGGTGLTAPGIAYICPDPSLNFQVVAPVTTHAVTISVPPGMNLNGASKALTLTAGHLYTAVPALSSTSAGWMIY
jgi:hypothetical protein